ncbi:hypothetical protein [Marinicellulosiphila megalodicopiae]|uniref:hypothetical protein n=1 Tax=Marinicellulosiphila megalodicopiae TaxID=2724896 RepID=UPI003BAE44E5
MATSNNIQQHAPSDDVWNYTNDTIRLLSLSVVQIKSILTDGGESVSELTDSFIHIAYKINKLLSDVDELTSNPEDLTEVHEKIQQGIVAFQFYDRISQRLDHVSNSLNQLTHIISDKDKRNQPETWINLQKGIKRKYTMESERVVFDKIMDGDSIENALEAYKAYSSTHEHTKDNSDDIELF